MVRVSAIQMAAGVDVEANKQRVLDLIDQAAEQQPNLMVFPEFCNHASWYQDKQHCFDVSLASDDPFFSAIGEKAKAYNCFIVVNVTLRRGEERCTGSSLLIDTDGKIRATSDKQVLMGHENDFLERAKSVTPVIDTELGRIGLYACMDGVINETPRGLAIRGAQILCNSLNSFGLDEGSLHIPVRAAENKVFVVAANKVGPLIPEDQLEMASQFTHIPKHFLYGSGESQIVAPDGTVLAKASTGNEEIITADIDPTMADNKQRPDGTDIFAARRPEIYSMISSQPETISYSEKSRSIDVCCWQVAQSDDQGIEEICDHIPQLAQSYQVLVLPELFFLKDLDSGRIDSFLPLSSAVLERITNVVANCDIGVVASFVMEGNSGLQHNVVYIDRTGVRLIQPQLHRCGRFSSIALGSQLETLDTDFGRLAIMTGHDAIFPESFRLAALQGCDVVFVSGDIQERWETTTGLMERAAENRMCLAYASRPSDQGSSYIANLESDFTLLTPWEKRIFDGNINRPWVRQAPNFSGLLGARLDLKNSHNKRLSGTTDVVSSRPWFLMEQNELPLT